ARGATTVGAGGQAANVAAWAAALGARARLVAVKSDDDAGRLIAGELDARGVEVRGPSGARTGVVVSLVSPEGERTMASDRGSAPELTAGDLEAEWLAGDALPPSGHAPMRGAIAGAPIRAAGAARAGRAARRPRPPARTPH